jgi:hypothetical protein
VIDPELQQLAAAAPDRPLEGLEADVWVTLARRDRAAHTGRKLLLLQAAVLLFALAGSLLVGRELARRQAPDSDNLAVFSTHLLLAPSAGSAATP